MVDDQEQEETIEEKPDLTDTTLKRSFIELQ